MIRTNRAADFNRLRKEYPIFVFENQEFRLDTEGLHIRFTFNLSDQYFFHPEIFIPRKDFFLPDDCMTGRLPALVFHLGMIELISYWKAACPPTIIIRPFALDDRQVEWWKRLYFNGLGEFFYLNSITACMEDFVDIRILGTTFLSRMEFSLDDSLLIPVGGGKDSAVTLGLTGSQPGALPLILNPGKAAIGSLKAAGLDASAFFEIRRTIDAQLLELNRLGFLNGHTPFSALLGFLTLLASAMTGKKHIVLSNESSANEPTIPGTEINHQYSKSFDFETGFRRYVGEWIHPEMNYFSFLRPLHELQIASLFAKMDAFHPIFRSCNAGSKTGIWCGQCPKCLFTCIILAPFLDSNQLSRIFGQDLFADAALIPWLEQLTGLSDIKPFECVGTIDEVNLALGILLEKYGTQPLPVLLEYYRSNAGVIPGLHIRFASAMNHFSPQHHLPSGFELILKNALHG